MSLKTVFENKTRFGLSAALYDAGLRAANHLVPLKILKGVCIEAPTSEFRELAEHSSFQAIDPAILRGLARQPQYELSEAFLDEALAKGDECYGMLEGDVLAAYGWYSTQPTAIEPPDLVLHFGPRYVYMYKGFTHPDYRGKRLHAIGMTYALMVYRSKGYQGIVSYVESNNFSSLRSCYRMGYKNIGSVYAVRIFGNYRIYSGAGCAAYEFRLEPAVEGRVHRLPAAA